MHTSNDEVDNFGLGLMMYGQVELGYVVNEMLRWSDDHFIFPVIENLFSMGGFRQTIWEMLSA